jgi:hypothetical protein
MKWWLRHLGKLRHDACPSFPVRNAKVEELIDWNGGEVKTVPDIVWQLNDNFIILAIEGVLNMLNGTGCQQLSDLRRLAASSDASVMQNIPVDVRRLKGRLVQKWWKSHGLHEAHCRLDTADTETVCDSHLR